MDTQLCDVRVLLFARSCSTLGGCTRCGVDEPRQAKRLAAGCARSAAAGTRRIGSIERNAASGRWPGSRQRAAAAARGAAASPPAYVETAHTGASAGECARDGDGLRWSAIPGLRAAPGAAVFGVLALLLGSTVVAPGAAGAIGGSACSRAEPRGADMMGRAMRARLLPDRRADGRRGDRRSAFGHAFPRARDSANYGVSTAGCVLQVAEKRAGGRLGTFVVACADPARVGRHLAGAARQHLIHRARAVKLIARCARCRRGGAGCCTAS